MTTTYIAQVDNGLCRKTESITLTADPCTDIQKLTDADKNINLFPNPFFVEFTIVNARDQLVEIYDSMGKLIHISLADKDVTVINLANHPPGMYLVKFGLLCKKVVKS